MKHLPKINLLYWALIISANTMGETAGDLISQTFNLGYAWGTLVLIVLFLIALTISMYSKNPLGAISVLSFRRRRNPIILLTLLDFSCVEMTRSDEISLDYIQNPIIY